ncbi:MAG: PAS domain S-box protein [Chroococcales cyanobacterium]
MKLRINPNLDQWQHFGIAIFAIAIATSLKILLEPLIHLESPFLLFLAAVMGSALYGGLLAGILTTILAVLVIQYLFLPPTQGFLGNHWDQNLRLVLFFIEGVLITQIITSLDKAKDRLQFSQKALNESETHFKSMVDSVEDYAIFMLDPKGFITSWNTGAQQIYGYRSDEIIGKHFSCFYSQPEIEEGKPKALLEATLLNNRIQKQEWLLRKDGTFFCANSVLTAFRDEQGKLQGFSNVTRNVTDRVAAEKALRESEERFRVTFEQAAVGIAHVSPDGTLMRVNQKLCDILGYTKEELLKLSIEDISHPDDYKINRDYIQKALANQISDYSMEKRYFRKDGSIVWANLTVSLIRESEGKGQNKAGIPKYFIAVIEDITQRKEAEKALQKRENELRLITNAVPVLIIYVNHQKQYVFTNSCFQDWFGYCPEFIQGKPIKSILKQDFYERISPYIERVLGGEKVSFNTYFLDAKGNQRYLSVNHVPQFQNEEVVGFVVVANDITEQQAELLKRKQAEDKIHQLNEELEQRVIERTSQLQKAYDEVELLSNRLNSIIEGTSDFVAGLDLDFRYIVFNDAFRKEIQSIFGQSITLGMSLQQVLAHIPPDQAKKSIDTWSRALNGEKFTVIECYGNKGQDQRFYELTYSPITNYQGTLIGASMIARNISDRIHYETEIHRLNEALEERVLERTSQLQLANKQLAHEIYQRQETEAALMESEERLRLALEAADLGSWYDDLTTGMLYWSTRCSEMFGLEPTRTDLDYDTFIACLHPNDREKTDAAVKKAIASQQDYGMEYRVLWPDGAIHWISAKGRPFYEGNTPTRMMGVVQDITERKEAEIALAESESRFRRLYESNIIGIVFSDLHGQIEDANDAFLAMVGYSREDLETGRLRWDILTTSESLGITQRAIAELKTTGVCFPFERGYIRQDGSSVPALMGAALLQGTQNKTIAYTLDLSERKQAEASLRESEERFRYLANVAPVLIWMSGIDKRANYFNQSWLEFTGRTLDQELGYGWVEGIYPDDLEACLESYNSAFDARQAFKIEYRLRRHDREYRWVLDEGIPRYSTNGEFLGYIGSCIDISDRKQAEAQMNELNQILERRVAERTTQLEATNKELETFCYSVSHDLRAPFRHITGFVELLLKRNADRLDESSLHYLNIISEAAQNAGKMVDDLLAFSRMGRTEMQFLPVNMTQLVEEVKQDFAPAENDRSIVWEIAPLPTVAGDASMLRLVWQNLLENALKYTTPRSKARITIGSYEKENETVFFVRDNGVGFDMRYVSKIFGIFQRLHSDAEFKGTGIGLANVQRIIHRHGGQTWAEGAVNQGASFYFSLPKFTQEHDTIKLEGYSAN